MKKSPVQEYTVLIERDEDGFYVGDVVELPGCHTQAKTQEELLSRMKEAILAYQEAKTGSTTQSPEFIGLRKIKVPRPQTA